MMDEKEGFVSHATLLHKIPAFKPAKVFMDQVK